MEEVLVAKLYLIRHGETVDNVAGVYAGFRDSALTNHGALQIGRLGAHFLEQGIDLDHIFSSDLIRAHKTALAIAEKQKRHVDVLTDAAIREQNYGSFEGKRFGALPSRDALRAGSSKIVTGDAEPIETKESMGARVDSFIDRRLNPLLHLSCEQRRRTCIAIVSHGILLSTFWKRLLLRQQPGTVSLSDAIDFGQKPVVLEHLGAWSNTGFLELSLFSKQPTIADQAVTHRSSSEVQAAETPSADPDRLPSSPPEETNDEVPAAPTPATAWPSLRIRVDKINCHTHLAGLKRTRGGVGSAKFDDGQSSIRQFFKKEKKA